MSSRQVLADLAAEIGIGHGPAGDADDREVLGQQMIARQVDQGRQQLAFGEIAGRPEDDDGARPGGLAGHDGSMARGCFGHW